MVDIMITVVCLIAIALLWVMLYDSNRFVVKNYAVKDARLGENFRAIFITDLHGKQYGRKNEKLLDAIRCAAPDVVFIGGDMLNANPGKDMSSAIAFLTELAKAYPIFYANGNHEYRLKLYPETYGDMGERYGNVLAEIGITPMINSSISPEKYNITVTGAEIDRIYYKRFECRKMDPAYLTELLGEPSKERFQILLAHHPDYFPAYAAWGADLVLAGHVHGGVAKIPFIKKGVISPSLRLFPKYDSGEFHEGGSTMILSAGLGAHTIPFRLFNPAELWVIDFSKDNKEED